MAILETPVQSTSIIVPIACIIGLLYAFYLYKFVAKVRVKPFKNIVSCNVNDVKKVESTIDLGNEENKEETKPTPSGQTTTDQETGLNQMDDKESMQKVFEIYQLIREGATSFLWAEYRYLAIYIVVFAVIIAVTIGVATKSHLLGIFASISFFIGAVTSIISGYIGLLSYYYYYYY